MKGYRIKDCIRFWFILIVIFVFCFTGCQNDAVIEEEEVPLSPAPVKVIVNPLNLLQEKFEYENVITGLINVEDLQYSASISSDTEMVRYTLITDENEEQVVFIEPEDQFVEMYNQLSVSRILAIIVSDDSRKNVMIGSENENYKSYKTKLLKSKRMIQNAKLTDLELILTDSKFLGRFEVYLKADTFERIRLIEFHLSSNNANVLVSENKIGDHYFLVDAEQDGVFNHFYNITSAELDVMSFKTADAFEHIIYGCLLVMIEEDRSEKLFDSEWGEIKIIKVIY